MGNARSFLRKSDKNVIFLNKPLSEVLWLFARNASWWTFLKVTAVLVTGLKKTVSNLGNEMQCGILLKAIKYFYLLPIRKLFIDSKNMVILAKMDKEEDGHVSLNELFVTACLSQEEFTKMIAIIGY